MDLLCNVHDLFFRVEGWSCLEIDSRERWMSDNTVSTMNWDCAASSKSTPVGVGVGMAITSVVQSWRKHILARLLACSCVWVHSLAFLFWESCSTCAFTSLQHCHSKQISLPSDEMMPSHLKLVFIIIPMWRSFWTFQPSTEWVRFCLLGQFQLRVQLLCSYWISIHEKWIELSWTLLFKHKR